MPAWVSSDLARCAADERELEQDVDRAPPTMIEDDHRPGEVLGGVAGLTGELHRLFEAEQREDDAAGRDRDEDRP